LRSENVLRIARENYTKDIAIFFGML